MPYTKSKKPYVPFFYRPYKQKYEEPKCYHDYQENMSEIMSNIKHNGLSAYKFVIVDKFVKDGVCIVDKTLGYKEGSKVKLVKIPGVGNVDSSPELRIVNTENTVSPAAVKVSTDLAEKCGYDFEYDIVQIAEV